MPETHLQIEKYFFWLVIYSVIGWVYESILETYRQKKLVNRGFLNGPYCPIYGSGALLDVVVLGWIENPVLLFLASAVLTCTLEYITSVILEKIFHIRWWDYNDFKFQLHGKEINMGKFNINGRICLVGAIAFGTLSIVILKVIHPIMEILTNNLSVPLFHYVCIGLLVLIMIDITFTVSGLVGFNEKLKNLSTSIIQITNGFKDSLDNKVQLISAREKINSLYEKFAKSLNFQQIRLFHAFSQLRSIDYGKITDELKKFVFRRKKK